MGRSRGDVSGADRSPDVILIVVDTLRADHLGVYGYERKTSPNLDAFARKAIVYENAFSQAPWTVPSVGSLLTSRFPTQLGLRKAQHLPEAATTMAEVLHDAGYATGGVVSHIYLGQRYNFHQGFDEFDASNAKGHKHISSASVTDLAGGFVADASRSEKPFFLFAHYFDPHYGYHEHEGFEFSDPARPYAGIIRPLITFTEIANFIDAGRKLVDEDLDRLRETYDSEIAFTDHHLGRLFDQLEERGVFESSLIIVTSDHGEEFWDHGSLGHSSTVYSELIHVPLIVKLPGSARGGIRIRQNVALLDVLPSVVSELGLEPDPLAAGTPLPLRNEDERDDAPAVFSQTFQALLDYRRPKDGSFVARSVIRGPEKLIQIGRPRSAHLFDLKRDPGEARDLARKERGRALTLGAQMLELDAASRKNIIERKEKKRPLREAERQQLQALGYIEAESGKQE